MGLQNRKIFLLITVCFLFFSCASRKDYVYVQNIDAASTYAATDYEMKLKPDDLLKINVTAENPEVAVPFNLSQLPTGAITYAEGQNYLIDHLGFINFPIIGKIKLAGLTTSDANKQLVKVISEYIKNPTIDVRILNFKISVLGEVTKPGSYYVQGERISVFEGLSLAGDLGVYGKRKNVLIIHEEDGKKTYNRVDITKADFLNSPQYYLSQNDIIFVEANKTKINSSVVGPNTSVILSVVSILITLSVILFRS